MKNAKISAIVVITGFLCALVSIAVRAQNSQDKDKYKVKAPNGVAFSEFKGYEDWQDVAVSRTGTTIKAILGNPAMIKAYRSGIPGNGKPFPDGVKMHTIICSGVVDRSASA